MRSKYLAVGVLIIVVMVGLVAGIRIIRGKPRPIEFEPHKIKGPSNAKHFIVVFSDFQCPFCAAIRKPLDQILAEFPKDLKLVYKHFPLRSHSKAKYAAQASECAADQGKFWAYHDLLFDRMDDWSRSKFYQAKYAAYATELELDTEKFTRCLESGQKLPIVDQNRKEGLNVFVAGTPTCLLNGRKVLTKMDDMEYVKNIIRKELASGPQ